MAVCTTCGKALEKDAKFCSECGTPTTGVQAITTSGAAAAVPAPVTRVVAVKPKKGGWLALKGLLIALILCFIFTLETRGGTQSVGMAIAFGVGAAYIVAYLRKWKKNNEIVRGADISWRMVIFLLIMCIGSLMFK